MSFLTFYIFGCLVASGQCINTDNVELQEIDQETNILLDIVGGERATRNSWHWHAELIMTPNGDDWFGICGATLVAPGWIATAGHCVTDPDSSVIIDPIDYRVLGGVTDLQNVNSEVQMINVSQIIVHPDFIPSDPCRGHDVAMLKLESDMEITDNTEILQMPGANQNFIGNDDCWIIGFGQTGEHTDESRYLLEANVPVIDNTECGDYLGIDLCDDYECVGDANDLYSTNACRGDSGGSLSCYDDGEWYFAGISSFGPQSCVLAPSAYTAVSSQRAFIRQVMNGGGANNPTSNIDIQIGDPICTPDLVAIKHARPINFT